MRIVLTILAVICSLFCAVLALANSLLVALAALELFGIRIFPHQPVSMRMGVSIVVFALLIAFLNYWMGIRAYRHRRQPSQRTAQQVFAIACFLVALELVSLIHGRLGKGTWIDTLSNQPYALGTLATIAVLALLYHLVLKRLATRAFPAQGPEAHA